MAKKKALSLPKSGQLDFIDDGSAAVLLNTPRRARLLLWMVFLFFVSALIWAYKAELDEVTIGQGKVIPSLQLQVIQNLEGGILKNIYVKEGDLVEKGQLLLQIDDTRFKSDFRTREQELVSLKASIARLQAEVQSVIIADGEQKWKQQTRIEIQEITFPSGLEKIFPELANRQKVELQGRLDNLSNQMIIIEQKIAQKEQNLIEVNAKVRHASTSYKLAKEELLLTSPLAKEGVVSQVELIQLQRQVNQLKGEMVANRLLLPKLQSELRETILKRRELALNYKQDLQKQLNEFQDRLAQLSEGQVGLKDRVARTEVLSPVKGTVKKLYLHTVGGVIQPGMDMMEIVPAEDTLLIEAKIAPKDIAFIRPGLQTMAKFSAYDFTIYGGLKGTLEHISADTIVDEEGNSFYLVRIRTEANYLGERENSLPIIPGMLVSVDIITGKKTVLEYLLKPLLRAKQSALRER